MQPDSVQHTLQKLAEVRASRNAATSNTAPPPYTLSVHRPTGVSVMSLDQSESDPLYDQDPISPITIHIDNSITVTGNNNTIVLPSGPISPTSPTSPTTNPVHRDTSHLSSLAATIIAALNRANALRDELGVPRPVSIDINHAIRIEGNNNTMPQATPKRKAEYVDAGVGRDRDSYDNAQKRRASSVPPETPRPLINGCLK